MKALFKVLFLPFVKLYRWLMYKEQKSILKNKAAAIFKNEVTHKRFLKELDRARREKVTGKRSKKFKKAPRI